MKKTLLTLFCIMGCITTGFAAHRETQSEKSILLLHMEEGWRHRGQTVDQYIEKIYELTQILKSARDYCTP